MNPGILPLLRKTWLRLALLAAAAFLVHLPSLEGGLIWDDYYLVGENPFFRSPIFSLELFRHYLYLDSFAGHYRPVQNLSYILDYLLWNGELYGYHLSNLLWHASAGVLLFLLLRKLFVPAADLEQRDRNETGAFLIALLWVLHPVHSAAVDYISGRADSLAFVFCSGAWLLYLHAIEVPRRPLRWTCHGLALLLLLLGLCAREIALIWICIFLLHLFCFRKGVSRPHRCTVVIACLCAVALYAVLRHLPGSRGAALSSTTWGTLTRAGLILRALGDYVCLTIWPANLHMERSVIDARMFHSSATWSDQFAFSFLSAAGLLAVAALCFGALKSGPGRPLRIFGALWFGCGFVPISNLFDLNATCAEHWLYLPLVGLLLVFCGWLMELPAQRFRLAVFCACALAIALGARSAVRSTDWLTAQGFYERTIAAGGWSPRVAANLATIYEEQGRIKEARALLERCLRAWPQYPLAQSHLATILALQGSTAEADRLLAATAAAAPAQRREYPRTWTASLQFADREIEQHRDDEALRVLENARRLDPNVWPLAALEAETLRRVRGPAAALPVIEKFAAENWWQYPAFLALGKLRAQQGDVAAALAALNHASRLDIHETEALNLVARIELRQRNFDAAITTQLRAISRQPNRPSQYIFFSEMLRQIGRPEQAQRMLAKARSIEIQG